MSDLLPCPFCGEAPSIMSVGMAGQPRWQHPVNDTCPIAGHYLGGWDFPVQWNQRALPAVQPDDLIRRMDAVQACQVGPSDEWSRSTKSGYNQAATDCAMNILRVPAVQPDVRIKEYEEALECNEQFSVDNQILRERVAKAEAERDRLKAKIRFLERRALD